MSINRSLDTFLTEAQVALDNSLNNPDILQAVSDLGYTTPRLREGKKLYNLAAAAQLEQQMEAGGQLTASQTLQDTWATAKKSYIRFVKIARVAFKRSTGVATQLSLSGKRKESLSGWLGQANQFYKSALADKAILTGLKEFGITEQKLKAGLAELQAVEAANLTQEKEKGEAQAATKRRDAAIDELQDWLSDYLAIAKIALEEEPQLLEGLGILVRS
ncbi:MAG: hypothetical protein AAFP09_16130 [Cyanobacteria bacterium J06607_10]